MNFGILLLVGVFCIAVSGQEKQCSEIGGYCQNHWDCCSNSCLSYSYKCVKSYQNGGWEDDIPKEELTLDELLEKLHLNGKSKKDEPECLAVGYQCSSSEQCCTKRCPSFWGRCTT